MTRSTDTRGPSAELPSFLEGDVHAQADAAATQAQDDQHGEDYDGDVEHFEAEYEDADESDEGCEHGDYELDEGAGDSDQQHAVSTAPAARRRRYGATVTPSGGVAALTIGVVVVAAGLTATFVPAAGAPLLDNGVQPHVLTLVGFILFALGAGQRRVGRMQQRLEQYEHQRHEHDEEVRATLVELLDRPAHAGENAAEAQDLQHALLALQRQDQKINNLTKAIKMYGKPLMEIAGQGTELAGAVAQVRALVDAGVSELRQQQEQLGAELAASSQQTVDSEVREQLTRIEDAGAELRSAITALRDGAATSGLGDTLQQRLDEATRGLAEGIQQLREGDVAALETTAKDIQREVAGLATSVAQIQAAVKSGARPAVEHAPAQAASTQSASPQQEPTQHGSTQHGSTQHGSTPQAPAGADGDQDAGSGYSTGKRKSGGKNVLGAIAKLKQMKG